MKIPPIQRQQAISAYAKSPVQGVSQVRSASMQPDAVEISPEGAAFSETFRAVMKSMQQVPEQQRVRHEEAARNVREGVYDVAPDQVASAMLRGLKLDREV